MDQRRVDPLTLLLPLNSVALPICTSNVSRRKATPAPHVSRHPATCAPYVARDPTTCAPHLARLPASSAAFLPPGHPLRRGFSIRDGQNRG